MFRLLCQCVHEFDAQTIVMTAVDGAVSQRVDGIQTEPEVRHDVPEASLVSSIRQSGREVGVYARHHGEPSVYISQWNVGRSRGCWNCHIYSHILRNKTYQHTIKQIEITNYILDHMNQIRKTQYVKYITQGDCCVKQIV